MQSGCGLPLCVLRSQGGFNLGDAHLLNFRQGDVSKALSNKVVGRISTGLAKTMAWEPGSVLCAPCEPENDTNDMQFKA